MKKKGNDQFKIFQILSFDFSYKSKIDFSRTQDNKIGSKPITKLTEVVEAFEFQVMNCQYFVHIDIQQNTQKINLENTLLQLLLITKGNKQATYPSSHSTP